MPKRMLVAYETNAGSTEQVARLIGETLTSDHAETEVCRLGEVKNPVLKKTPQIKPVSIALFAGKLDYSALKLHQMVFVMLLFAVKPRDYRNWDTIRGWAANLRPRLLDGI